MGYFLHGLKADIRGKVRSLAALGMMNRARLLQVTRTVEKKVRGERLKSILEIIYIGG